MDDNSVESECVYFVCFGRVHKGAQITSHESLLYDIRLRFLWPVLSRIL